MKEPWIRPLMLMLISCATCHAGKPAAPEQEVVSRWEEVAKAAAFSITHRYEGDSSEGSFFEMLTFRDLDRPAVRLKGYDWPASYQIAPGEHWILRTQKVGSGTSEVFLYRIEDNGRVTEVADFDSLVWAASDKTARLKAAKLYHTEVTRSKWSEDGKSLTLFLRGSNEAKQEDDMTNTVTYYVDSHTFTSRPVEAAKPGS